MIRLVPRRFPLLVLVLAACAPALPGPGGARPVAGRADTLWSPPPARRSGLARALAESLPALPATLLERRQALTLEDVVGLALQGNPEVRAAWATARARAAALGAARGAWFPTVTGEGSVTRLQTAATQGRSAVQQTIYETSASFTWLLMDVGGRAGSIDVARQGLIAANWTHNATLQTVVARTAGAYFEYAAAKALLSAQQVTVREAEANLAAADERRRVGVATIADVLQARTALAQARLDLQAIEGNLFTTRGALAASTGYPATLEYDIDTTAVLNPVQSVAEEVDSLIGRALEARPDLAAGRASYEQARARVRVAGAARLPSLVGGGAAGVTWQPGQTGGREAYNLSLGLRIPIFNGFTWEYQRAQAAADADAARARAESLEQQVIFEVFSAYYTLRTATTRVATADELLASATESSAAARGRYQSGVGSLLELLTAENALAAARAQRIQARLGWQAALVELARNAGVLDLRGGSPLRLAPPSAPTDSQP